MSHEKLTKIIYVVSSKKFMALDAMQAGHWVRYQSELIKAGRRVGAMGVASLVTMALGW